jgi:chitin disaccharide deacetylase
MNSNVFHISVLLRRLLVEEIARKMYAQLGKLRDFGVPISYVDSHGHLHKFVPFLRAMRTVLPRFGIRRVRNVQNVFLKPPRKSPIYWVSQI